MITLARYDAVDILPFIGEGKSPIQFPFLGVVARVGSRRMECLKRNQKCVMCGCRGSVFLLQKHERGQSHRTNCFIQNCAWCSLMLKEEAEVRPHLNLYHVGSRGGLVMMTQDHIIPRSRGGSNELENLQTMCANCNQAKGNSLPHEIHQPKLSTGISDGQEWN